MVARFCSFGSNYSAFCPLFVHLQNSPDLVEPTAGMKISQLKEYATKYKFAIPKKATTKSMMFDFLLREYEKKVSEKELCTRTVQTRC